MEDATRPDRPSGTKLAIIGLLAFVGLVSFLVLADVRLNQGDFWFEGLSDAASKSTMTWTLIGIEAAAFLGALVLLLLPGSARPQEDEWISTGGVRMGGDGTRIQIGCPGCGTVFEKPLIDVDEEHEQHFRCPNCGREGHLRMEVHKPVEIRKTVCSTCDKEFQSYRAGAECPHCHAPN